MTPRSKNKRIVRFSPLFFLWVLFLPLSVGAETDRVEHETGIYYTVQKGDTLWSLSRKFSDTPWQWPELWNENKQILNPHLIYPGQRIRLFYNKGVLNLEVPEKEISKQVEPAPPPYLIYSSIDQVGFVRKDAVALSGTIVQAEGIKTMISENEIIYVTAEDGVTLVPGDRYITLRTLPLSDPDSGKRVGYQHLYTGLLEIIRQEGEAAMARVKASFQEMKVGDGLIPFVPKESKITILPGKPGLEGKVLASERRDNIFSSDTVAFINKGAADGVEKGQWYALMEPVESTAKKGGKSLAVNPVQVGKLFVLCTEEQTATVLIGNSKKDLAPGQLFVYSTQ